MEMIEQNKLDPSQLGYTSSKPYDIHNTIQETPDKIVELKRKKSMVESQMDEREYNELLEQIKKETENMWITDLFVDSPCKPICACYIFLLLCLVITGAAGYCIPALGGDRDFNLWLDPI